MSGDEVARLTAENAALRRKISRIESVKRFMAEQVARRVPEAFHQAVIELDRVLSEPMYDPQTGALIPDSLRTPEQAMGVWQGRMNMACLRLDRYAEWRAEMGNEIAARAYRNAADIVGEEYHAALCDLAGGDPQ